MRVRRRRTDDVAEAIADAGLVWPAADGLVVDALSGTTTLALRPGDAVVIGEARLAVDDGTGEQLGVEVATRDGVAEANGIEAQLADAPRKGRCAIGPGRRMRRGVEVRDEICEETALEA